MEEHTADVKRKVMRVRSGKKDKRREKRLRKKLSFECVKHIWGSLLFLKCYRVAMYGYELFQIYWSIGLRSKT